MHGDFSLNPLAHRDAVTRVLFQQGRVQLDSDANEQTEAMLRSVRDLARDVIGAHGGLKGAFEISMSGNDPVIGLGTYYVDGLRCVNFKKDVWTELADTKKLKGLLYREQTGYFPPAGGQWRYGLNEDEPGLFYLDVFERHVSAAEDDSLLEKALQGPDTASRAVLVWQVRVRRAQPFLDKLTELDALTLPAPYDLGYVALNLLLRSGIQMRARAVVTDKTDACTIAPDARYRGIENHLFRVEIHNSEETSPTFKWSPDNASIVYPIRKVEGRTVHLDTLGRDERTTIQINDWVEVIDDEVLLMGKALPLRQVVLVDAQQMTVTLSEEPEGNAGRQPDRHPILRRWATADVELKIGKGKQGLWIGLADGVEVEFSDSSVPNGVHHAGYRTGDYWLIPTRTATGDVQWPSNHAGPRYVSPHGIEHHYAPLAVVDHNGVIAAAKYRREFSPSAPVPPEAP